jgi:APA family basic amino acid/polyamine antiporter
MRPSRLSVLAALGAERLARFSAPLADAGGAGNLVWLAPAARAGAALASFGVLLSLLAAVRRTVLAVARNRELPRTLDAVPRDIGSAPSSWSLRSQPSRCWSRSYAAISASALRP